MSSGACADPMSRLCSLGCGRLAGDRKPTCCVHCPGSHTRTCQTRQRARASPAPAVARPPAGTASRPAPADDENAEGDDGEAAQATEGVVRDLLELVEAQAARIQELTQAGAEKDALLTRVTAERDALARALHGSEPAPEPQVTEHAARVGEVVTPDNFLPGYLVLRARGLQESRLGLYAVRWQTLAEVLGVRAGQLAGSGIYQRHVQLYAEAMAEWRQAGRAEPLRRVA